MRISTRFSVSIHILAMLFLTSGTWSSDSIAQSIDINPVVVRRLMSYLRKAGFISSHAGVRGAKLLKKPDEVSLFDVYKAVEPDSTEYLFDLYRENPDCEVSKELQVRLKNDFSKAQLAMEEKLNNVLLSDIIDDMRKNPVIKKEYLLYEKKDQK